MAISESVFDNPNLVWDKVPQIRITNGKNLTLQSLQQMIKEKADENGIPVDFRPEELKTGGVFNRQKEPVLVMYNPEHSDYLSFLIRLRHQGNYAFLTVIKYGGSDLYRDSNRTGIIGGLTRMVKGTDSKLQAAEEYYDILADSINDLAH